MSFATDLTAHGLTAQETARAVSPLLSVRTVEDWLQGRRTPPDWTHEWILSRVTAAAKRKAKRVGTLSHPA